MSDTASHSNNSDYGRTISDGMNWIGLDDYTHITVLYLNLKLYLHIIWKLLCNWSNSYSQYRPTDQPTVRPSYRFFYTWKDNCWESRIDGTYIHITFICSRCVLLNGKHYSILSELICFTQNIVIVKIVTNIDWV